MFKRFLHWILVHPISVVIGIVLLGIVGFLSLVNIPLEIRPQQTLPKIQIQAVWGSQPPEVIQRMVTIPLEDVATQVRNVRNVKSTSGVGYSRITLEFPPKEELKYAYIALQEQIAALRGELPKQVMISVEPVPEDDENNSQQRQPFANLELNGPMTLNQLRRIADRQLLPALQGLNGVGHIDVFGGSALQLRVDLNTSLIRKLQLNPATIAATIRIFLQRKGLGEIRYHQRDFTLIYSNLQQRPQDLSKIPVAGRNKWTLGDIATISIEYERPVTLFRHNYNPLISLAVYKAAGYNALTFSRDLHTRARELIHNLPQNLQFHITTDSADNLRGELNSLLLRGSVILVIVLLILFGLFRRFSISLNILSVILLSLLGASILLYFTGYTINVVTLAGIALVFGMLVDNAVVVLENIHRHEQVGESVFTSGLHGTLEMVRPLIGGTLTTVFVFFALLLLRNRLGEYYHPLAVSLGSALLISLLLAVTLIPALYIRFRLLGAHRKTKNRQHLFSTVQQKYRNIVSWNVRHRGLIYLVIAGLSLYSVWLFLNHVERGGFYHWGAEDEIRVAVSAPRGVTLETLDNITRGFEQQIRGAGIPCDVRTTVNSTSAYAAIRVTFPDSVKWSSNPYLLKAQLTTQAVNYAGVGIYISGFGLPYYNGGYRITPFYNTRLQVSGPQYDRLWEVCQSILDIARKSPRVVNGIIVPSTRSLYEADMKQISLSASLSNLWDKGWTFQSLQKQLRLWVSRTMQFEEVPLGQERFPVRITAGKSPPQFTTLQNAILSTPGGRKFRVKNLLRVQQHPMPLWIDKKNQQYEFTIAWEYRGPEQLRYRHEQSIVKHLELPPGYHLEQQAWSFLTKKEEADLFRLIGIVLLGTYMILAGLYESFRRPFVIFLSVPFALIGVLLSYAIFGRAFNINGYIGVILLSGIVVNNAIILVDRIDQLRKENYPLLQAVTEATVQRIRPILITTLTTIGGLIPLFFLHSGSSTLSGILQELSFITVGGLVSSTVLTITIIPLVYVSIEKLAFHWAKYMTFTGSDHQ